MIIQELLKYVLDSGSSDLHLMVGSPPAVRNQGRLSFIPNTAAITEEEVSRMILSTFNQLQKEKFLTEKEIDYSYSFSGMARFRINAYNQKGMPAAAFRLILATIPTIDSMGLPQICHTFSQLHQGFVLVTGPTGSGKSSTLAAIIEEINLTRSEHIITIEDPIEFVFQNKKSIISQREVGGDTKSFHMALRSTLRQDPNVVLIGEMRDHTTIKMAMTTAETGHLVFSTLHTNSASQTIDRIIDSFTPEQQPQIRSQLANSLEAVFSQRLVPTKDGKRVLAYEVMVATPAVKSNIREGKTHQLDNIIQTSSEMGMIMLESSLANFVNRGIVDKEIAYKYCNYPTVLARLIGESK